MDFVTNGVIEWNRREWKRAMADANSKALRLPASARKMGPDGKMVPMTEKEYRDMRARDAARYSRNIAVLEGQRGAEVKNLIRSFTSRR